MPGAKYIAAKQENNGCLSAVDIYNPACVIFSYGFTVFAVPVT